jgi:plastocyanin domain-containing protein
MNKIALSIIAAAVFVSLGIMFFNSAKPRESQETNPPRNVEMRNGVQYVTITARGGYVPRASVAKANVPTKLIVKTNGTYDCSAALVIRSIGYQKILPQNGEEVIDLGVPQSGILRGVCGMGMYGFTVDFK